MTKGLRKSIISLANRFGYGVTRLKDEQLKQADMTGEKAFMRLYEQCRPYTMTSQERLFALHQAVQYVLKARIEGDFVECGVWRGGSSMMSALTLLAEKQTNRKLYLYDTFEGMSEPTENDVNFVGDQAFETWDGRDKCLADLPDVQQNMGRTAYPPAQIQYVKGKVEDTIPQVLPEKIALLRLDTDWYESTYHELVHLYPRLAKGGVLIIDDYGHWQGARKAVDQYFAENNIPLLLNRIDYTGRMAVKL